MTARVLPAGFVGDVDGRIDQGFIDDNDQGQNPAQGHRPHVIAQRDQRLLTVAVLVLGRSTIMASSRRGHRGPSGHRRWLGPQVSASPIQGLSLFRPVPLDRVQDLP